ncbi:MAG TPA: aminotransferase class V-fold PLP-dependent enzyme [Dongiaceae bacterium]
MSNKPTNGHLPNQPKTPVYLDYQSTTPVDPRVLEIMLPYFTEKFGNPHSTSHSHGRIAAEAVEAARDDVARLIGAEAREIVFTSGATESNNIAVKGAARFLKDRRNHVVTCITEHKCVLESVKRLGQEGFAVTWLPVGRDGLVDLAALETAITDRTALVTIMAVNNEIGVIQPLAEIGKLAHAKGALFHTDAAQAAGKIWLDVQAMNIDLLSISGHKMYAPKGIGALYVRRRPRVRLEPLFDGGGQERGVRSGTLPAPLCVALGAAARIARESHAEEGNIIGILRRRFLNAVARGVPDAAVNGSESHRFAGNINLRLPGVDAQRLLEQIPELSLSLGSACTSAEVEPSYVLRAIGLSDTEAAASLRVGLGRFTTEAEVDFAAERLTAAAGRLRAGDAKVPSAAQ